jgi:DMSO/TMAO reductase YedYZ heme-binding membrane subunit
MTQQQTRWLDILVALVAIGHFVLRQIVEVPAPVHWVVLGTMVAYTVWRMRRRSPYRDRAKALHLDSK